MVSKIILRIRILWKLCIITTKGLRWTDLRKRELISKSWKCLSLKLTDTCRQWAPTRVQECASDGQVNATIFTEWASEACFLDYLASPLLPHFRKYSSPVTSSSQKPNTLPFCKSMLIYTQEQVRDTKDSLKHTSSKTTSQSSGSYSNSTKIAQVLEKKI